MKSTLYYLILLFIFTSCARRYHPVKPSVYHYDYKKQLSDQITLSYSYNIQAYFQNKPYARKERNYGKKLIAIKIENNSDSALTLTKENLSIKTPSGSDIVIIDQIAYTQTIRQFPEAFIIFYGIAGVGVRIEEVNGEKSTSLYYNPIPILIGIANAIFAGSANSKQERNLTENQILNKVIEPKSIHYGLITIEEENNPELEFFLKKDKN